jgi:hypothetical protein
MIGAETNPPIRNVDAPPISSRRDWSQIDDGADEVAAIQLTLQFRLYRRLWSSHRLGLALVFGEPSPVDQSTLTYSNAISMFEVLSMNYTFIHVGSTSRL